jgi:hypothetical protein
MTGKAHDQRPEVKLSSSLGASASSFTQAGPKSFSVAGDGSRNGGGGGPSGFALVVVSKGKGVMGLGGGLRVGFG